MVMSQESITIRESSDIRIVYVNEDLGGHVFASLRQKLNELVNQNVRKIVVNLSQVEHINSLAIGVMVGTSKKLREDGGDLKVYGLTEHIREIFDLIGTSEVLEIHDSETSALDAF
jgi:anti-sigma B factor antagonist